MRKKQAFIGVLVITIFVAGYFFLRNPGLSTVYDGGTRYYQYTGDNSLLLVDVEWRIKKADIRKSAVDDIGRIERGSYNHMFSPEGDYISYVYNNNLHIRSIESLNDEPITAPAQTYTWQSNNLVTFIDISSQEEESTFFTEGLLSTIDVTTGTKSTTSNQPITATSLHALDDTTGIYTIAYGEGGENRSAVATYTISDGSTETLSTEVMMDTIYASYGYFSYKDSSADQITIYDNSAQAQEIIAPENYTDKYALAEGSHIIAEARNNQREIVVKNISEQSERTAFTMEGVGPIQSIDYADSRVIIQTSNALYSGRIRGL